MPQIIEAGGRRWVAGLVWHGYSTKPKPKELQKTAAEEKADWVAVRPPLVGTTATQAGFCVPVPGEPARPRGLYSLAAAIADKKAQPWLGVYEIADDLWWMIAVVHNHSILTEGDVVGTRAEIRKARDSLRGHAGWEFYEGTLKDDLLPILASRKRRAFARVKSVIPVPPARLFGPPLAATAGLVACFYLWNWHLHAEETARERALIAARAHHHAPAPISPLAITPTPDTWLQACAAAINPLPLTVAGWALSGIACDRSGVDLKWTRLDGGTTLLRPPGVLSSDGNTIVGGMALPRLPAGPDKTLGLETDTNILFGLLQSLGITAQISAPALPPQLPGLTSRPASTAIPESVVRFSVPFSPWLLSLDVPGFRLTEMHQTTQGWDLTGEIYGR
jgi:hypothetical protein